MKIYPRQHTPIVDQDSSHLGCTCGKDHPAPKVTLYSAADACRVMAEDCSALYGNHQVLLLSDPETDAVAGQSLRRELERCGVFLKHQLLQKKPVATDSLVETVQTAGKDASLIISVGSGTVNDLGKYAADRKGIDFWTMPTAPSMNGYTSGIAAIKVKGVKRTLAAAPPRRIYVLPEVIQQAPLKMRLAGFCDVLAKVVSDIDWQCESLLVSNSYCGLPAAMMATVEKSYSEYPEEIGRGEQTSVLGLFKGLLLSGVAMSLAGSSAPASGGEHLLSHFLDMRESITDREPELHGLQVGLGIILSTACYRRLAQLEKDDLLQRAEQLFSSTATDIRDIWGQYAGEVAKQFHQKRDILLQFDTLLPKNWHQLQPLFRQVRTPEYFVNLFSRTGAPFTLQDFRLTKEEFVLAAINSRAIRDRLTVLDVAAHAGVLERATEDALQLLA